MAEGYITQIMVIMVTVSVAPMIKCLIAGFVRSPLVKQDKSKTFITCDNNRHYRFTRFEGIIPVRTSVFLGKMKNTLKKSLSGKKEVAYGGVCGGRDLHCYPRVRLCTWIQSQYTIPFPH